MDEKYYEATRPGSFSERMGIAARGRIYDDFIRACRPRPEDSIIDVGVSDVTGAMANVIERRYPHPRQVTAAGLGDGCAFRTAFPDISYVQIVPGQRLPFQEKEFDIATSNAVLEHVGSRDAQISFTAEMARIARCVFISVPNRLFPVEHHTGIPFLHWSDASFRIACALLHKDGWAKHDNLILMTERGLRGTAPARATIITGRSGLRAGRFSSNLFLYITA